MRHFNFNQTFAKSLDTELDRLDALLSRQESRIRAAFGEFVAGAQSEAAVKEAADLLAKGDVEGALKVVDRYVARLASVLPTVYQQAAAVELVAIGEQLAPLLPTVAVSFDPTDTRAAMVMREASLEFIRGFTAGQRDATRQALTQAFMDGSGTAATARAFRDSIGLSAHQEQAVRNYRNLLEQGSRQALDRALRDRRFDRTVTRAADGGDPLTAEQIDRMTDAYRRKFLGYRSEVIARTEAVRAVSQARQLAFEQNLEIAGVSRQAASATWRATMDSRVRDTHKAMSGQEQPFGSAFQSPSGAVLRYPGDPLAPLAEIAQCRCHLTFKIDPTALEFAKAFNPNQARDDHGRWTATGAGGGLRGFLRAIQAEPGKTQVYEAWPVENSAAILRAGGPDTTGWARVMEGSAVTHALKSHGRGAAKWVTGSRLAKADLARIPQILLAATPTYYQRGGGARLRYDAEIEGVRYTYIETVGRKQRRLLFKTMWRKG